MKFTALVYIELKLVLLRVSRKSVLNIGNG